MVRDGGCVFPGCQHDRFLHCHHIEHWLHGGQTVAGNLLLLCRRHHRYVHEHGFRVELDENGDHTGEITARFRDPYGRVIPATGELIPRVGALDDLRTGRLKGAAVLVP